MKNNYIKNANFDDLENEDLLKAQEKKFSLIKNEIDRLRATIKTKNELIEDLQNQLKKSGEDSYKNGFNEGYQKAQEDIKDELTNEYNIKFEALSNDVNSILNDIVKAKRNVILSAEREILELVFLVAEKIVQKEIEQDKTVILNVIKNILPHIDSYEHIKIIAHPDDIKVLKDNQQLWEPITLLKEHLTFEGKSSINRGGLIIHTKSGIIDARVEVELNHLKTKFLELWVASGDSSTK